MKYLRMSSATFLDRLFFSRVIEYKRQNYLTVVVNVNIIDQCSQTARNEIQVSRAFLVAVMSECC